LWVVKDAERSGGRLIAQRGPPVALPLPAAYVPSDTRIADAALPPRGEARPGLSGKGFRTPNREAAMLLVADWVRLGTPPSSPEKAGLTQFGSGAASSAGATGEAPARSAWSSGGASAGSAGTEGDRRAASRVASPPPVPKPSAPIAPQIPGCAGCGALDGRACARHGFAAASALRLAALKRDRAEEAGGGGARTRFLSPGFGSGRYNVAGAAADFRRSLPAKAKAAPVLDNRVAIKLARDAHRSMWLRLRLVCSSVHRPVPSEFDTRPAGLLPAPVIVGGASEEHSVPANGKERRHLRQDNARTLRLKGQAARSLQHCWHRWRCRNGLLWTHLLRPLPALEHWELTRRVLRVLQLPWDVLSWQTPTSRSLPAQMSPRHVATAAPTPSGAWPDAFSSDTDGSGSEGGETHGSHRPPTAVPAPSLQHYRLWLSGHPKSRAESRFQGHASKLDEYAHRIQSCWLAHKAREPVLLDPVYKRYVQSYRRKQTSKEARNAYAKLVKQHCQCKVMFKDLGRPKCRPNWTKGGWTCPTCPRPSKPGLITPPVSAVKAQVGEWLPIARFSAARNKPWGGSRPLGIVEAGHNTFVNRFGAATLRLALHAGSARHRRPGAGPEVAAEWLTQGWVRRGEHNDELHAIDFSSATDTFRPELIQAAIEVWDELGLWMSAEERTTVTESLGETAWWFADKDVDSEKLLAALAADKCNADILFSGRAPAWLLPSSPGEKGVLVRAVRGAPMGVRSGWPLLDCVTTYLCAHAERRADSSGHVPARGVTCGDDALLIGPPRDTPGGSYERFCERAKELGLSVNGTKTYSGRVGVFCEAFFEATPPTGGFKSLRSTQQDVRSAQFMLKRAKALTVGTVQRTKATSRAQARLDRALAATKAYRPPSSKGKVTWLPAPSFCGQVRASPSDTKKEAATGHTRLGGAIWGAPAAGPRGDLLPLGAQNIALTTGDCNGCNAWSKKCIQRAKEVAAELVQSGDPDAWRAALAGNDAVPVCAPLQIGGLGLESLASELPKHLRKIPGSFLNGTRPLWAPCVPQGVNGNAWNFAIAKLHQTQNDAPAQACQAATSIYKAAEKRPPPGCATASSWLAFSGRLLAFSSLSKVDTMEPRECAADVLFQLYFLGGSARDVPARNVAADAFAGTAAMLNRQWGAAPAPTLCAPLAERAHNIRPALAFARKLFGNCVGRQGAEAGLQAWMAGRAELVVSRAQAAITSLGNQQSTVDYAVRGGVVLSNLHRWSPAPDSRQEEA
jgi:hypothetical protein